MLDKDMDCEARSAVSLEALRRGVLVVVMGASVGWMKVLLCK